MPHGPKAKRYRVVQMLGAIDKFAVIEAEKKEK